LFTEDEEEIKKKLAHRSDNPSTCVCPLLSEATTAPEKSPSLVSSLGAVLHT